MSRPTPASLSVLVVEDHADGADTVATMLRMHGHRAAVARTAAEAVAAATADPPDVVLLDIQLPDRDGWSVARWLHDRARAGGRKPHVVAVTGCNSEDDRARSLAAGVDLHLVKPVDPAVLLGVLVRFERVVAPGVAPLGPPPAGVPGSVECSGPNSASAPSGCRRSSGGRSSGGGGRSGDGGRGDTECCLATSLCAL